MTSALKSQSGTDPHVYTSFNEARLASSKKMDGYKSGVVLSNITNGDLAAKDGVHNNDDKNSAATEKVSLSTL